MTHYARNHLQDDWQADADADYERRLEGAEREAGVWFDRATVQQLAVHRASCAAIKHLPLAEQEAAHDRAKKVWQETTAVARALLEKSVAELMEHGETSVETDAEWDALLDLRAKQDQPVLAPYYNPTLPNDRGVTAYDNNGNHGFGRSKTEALSDYASKREVA